jgi:hypothetical protein
MSQIMTVSPVYFYKILIRCKNTVYLTCLLTFVSLKKSRLGIYSKVGAGSGSGAAGAKAAIEF